MYFKYIFLDLGLHPFMLLIVTIFFKYVFGTWDFKCIGTLEVFPY